MEEGAEAEGWEVEMVEGEAADLLGGVVEAILALVALAPHVGAAVEVLQHPQSPPAARTTADDASWWLRAVEQLCAARKAMTLGRARISFPVVSER